MKAEVKKEITKEGVKYYGKIRVYAKTTGYMDYFIGPYKTRQEALQAAQNSINNASY